MAENKNTAASRNRAMKFFRETKSEMKKVSWPDKKQLFHNTVIILAFIAIATVFLTLVDAGFEKVLSLILK